MAKMKLPVYVDLMSSMHKTVSAHRAIADSVIAYAIKHHESKEAAREQKARDDALTAGQKNG